jgi:hypothetical protein
MIRRLVRSAAGERVTAWRAHLSFVRARVFTTEQLLFR